MRKSILLAGFFAGILFLSSCVNRVMKGEGNIGTVTAKVPSFNAVQVELPLKVIINVQKGVQSSVKFTGYSNFLLHIKTKVENNMLFISSDLDDRMGMDSKQVTAEITVPQITELYLSSTADADIHGNVTGQSLKIEVSGDSKMNIENINTDNFSYTASGTTDLNIAAGTVRIATFSIDGGSHIRAFPLQVKEASVTIKGSGNCEITALKKLITNVAGSCSVKYKGRPVITKNPTGGTIDDFNGR